MVKRTLYFRLLSGSCLTKQVGLAERAATLVEDWAEEEMNDLDEETITPQCLPIAIVLEVLANMKRNYEEAFSRIEELENALGHSLTPQPPSYDVSVAAGAPKAAMPPRALIDHPDREQPPPNTQHTCVEVEKTLAGAQGHVKISKGLTFNQSRTKNFTMI